MDKKGVSGVGHDILQQSALEKAPKKSSHQERTKTPENRRKKK